jgi:hypothetical protein
MMPDFMLGLCLDACLAACRFQYRSEKNMAATTKTIVAYVAKLLGFSKNMLANSFASLLFVSASRTNACGLIAMPKL